MSISKSRNEAKLERNNLRREKGELERSILTDALPIVEGPVLGATSGHFADFQMSQKGLNLYEWGIVGNQQLFSQCCPSQERGTGTTDMGHPCSLGKPTLLCILEEEKKKHTESVFNSLSQALMDHCSLLDFCPFRGKKRENNSFYVESSPSSLNEKKNVFVFWFLCFTVSQKLQ